MFPREKLRRFLDGECIDGSQTDAVVSEGTPYMEINKKAIEFGADMIILGSCGNTGDMDTIFFGSTAEKVLRFITRPVLCIPPQRDYKLQ